MGDLSLISAFMAGYCCDSLFSRVEAKAEKVKNKDE
jgi:hypothetical protein